MALWNPQYWGQLEALRWPHLSRLPAGRNASEHDAASVRPALPAELAVRVLAYAIAAGAIMVALLGAFPAPGSSSVGLLILAAFGFAAAVAIEVLADRIPPQALPVLTGLATGLAAIALYLRGETSTPYVLLLLFPVMLAFGLLPRRAAIGVLVVACASYAVALVAQANPPTRPVELWLVASLALAGVGAAVAWGRTRYEHECARLASAARTDPLTGLVNRRGFEESFELELERARRGGTRFSLLVGDLDGFKAVNDRYGHHTGDLALERVSRVLMRRKRRIDTVARLGGEEFALLLPDTSDRDSYMLAERLRAGVADEFAVGPAHLTVSFGVATYPDHGDSYESLLGAADDALYAAKELGRDRTVIFSREVPGILAPAGRNRARTRELEMLLTLAESLDLREESAPRHSRRVGRYAALAARELGLAAELVEQVRLAGVLHDVGKIALPDLMLSKPEPLSDEEWIEVRRHPEIGAHILANAHLVDIARWVMAHHERPDGRGFPRGLANGEIPLEARIIAVADAYVAMTSERPYRAAMDHEQARAELRRNVGRQFDERVVSAFIASLAREEAAI